MAAVMGLPQQRIVIYGAGGHGRVVADAAAAAGLEILGFLDDGVPVGHPILAWHVLGTLTWLEGRKDVAVAHGVGSNLARERVNRALVSRGVPRTQVVHPSAVVSRHARLGDGAVVLALAVLNAGADVGAGAVINTGAIVEHDVHVGDFAHVASNASLAGGARIEELSLLGGGATVLPGKTIGPRSVVGAGAVVTRDIPSDSVATGVPARVVRKP
ncbi:MAG: acetyltransferase [Bacteroidota bacterium]